MTTTAAPTANDDSIAAHCPGFCQGNHPALRRFDSYEIHEGPARGVPTSAASVSLRLMAWEDETGTVTPSLLALTVPDRNGDPALVTLDEDQALQLALAAMSAAYEIAADRADRRLWTVIGQHDAAGHASGCRCTMTEFDSAYGTGSIRGDGELTGQGTRGE